MRRQTGLTRIAAPEGMAAGAGYTHVVTGEGRLIAVSGQVALDEHGDVVGEGDPEAQARQVFENLRRCLDAAGATFSDVIKLTYYVTDMAHMPAIRAVRDEVIGARQLPASTAVQVVALVRPGLLLEIEAFAVNLRVVTACICARPRLQRGPVTRNQERCKLINFSRRRSRIPRLAGHREPAAPVRTLVTAFPLVPGVTGAEGRPSKLPTHRRMTGCTSKARLAAACPVMA